MYFFNRSFDRRVVEIDRYWSKRSIIPIFGKYKRQNDPSRMLSFARLKISNCGRWIADLTIITTNLYVNLLLDRSIYRPMCTKMGDMTIEPSYHNFCYSIHLLISCTHATFDCVDDQLNWWNIEMAAQACQILSKHQSSQSPLAASHKQFNRIKLLSRPYTDWPSARRQCYIWKFVWIFFDRCHLPNVAKHYAVIASISSSI